jgi:hypothetical protein
MDKVNLANLLTPKGREHAFKRINRVQEEVNIEGIIGNMSDAEYNLKMAKKYPSSAQKHYLAAMCCYERAGVFSLAKSIAITAGREDLVDLYEMILRS